MSEPKALYCLRQIAECNDNSLIKRSISYYRDRVGTLHRDIEEYRKYILRLEKEKRPLQLMRAKEVLKHKLHCTHSFTTRIGKLQNRHTLLSQEAIAPPVPRRIPERATALSVIPQELVHRVKLYRRPNPPTNPTRPVIAP